MPKHLISPHYNDAGASTLIDCLQYGLPIWHAGAHDRACQTANSLQYKPGVGATDGEGVERNWSSVDPMASSTKEMGKGNRHDDLDDQFSFNNFQKNIRLGALIIYFLYTQYSNWWFFSGDSLMHKLLIAIEECKTQVDAFLDVHATVDRDAAKRYIEEVEAWEKDDTLPNPYPVPRTGL